MATVRENILNAIKNELVDNGFNAKLTRMLPMDFSNIPLPYCFIFTDSEEKLLSGDDTIIGKETWVSRINVLLIDKESSIEDNVSAIYSLLFNNNFEGLIVMSSITRLDYFVVQVDKQLMGVSMLWNVMYRHLLGDMTKYN